MKLYAETAGLRARQLLGDLATLAWTAGWVAAGLALYRLVERLAVPGARVEQTTGSGPASFFPVEGIRAVFGPPEQFQEGGQKAEK